MNVITISLATVVGLCIVFIIIGLWFKRFVVSSEDFMLAGRKAPFWLLAAAYLGGFVGGSSVAGYVSLWIYKWNFRHVGFALCRHRLCGIYHRICKKTELFRQKNRSDHHCRFCLRQIWRVTQAAW